MDAGKTQSYVAAEAQVNGQEALVKISRYLMVSLMAAFLVAAVLGGQAQADRASAHYHKALAFKRQGKLDEAIKALHLALENREDYAAAHHSLGMLYRQQGNHPKAAFHLERAAKLEPKSSMIQYSLGILYHQMGRKADAIRVLTGAAALAPKDDTIQFQLCVLLIRQDPNKAIPYLAAALKVKPQNADYLHMLGLAYRRTKKLKQALDLMTRASALKEDAKIEFDLGVLYRRMEQPLKAIQHYEKAVQLDPKFANAYWDLAHVYTQAKRDDEAVGAFQSYLKLAGSSKDADIARKRIKELKKGK